MRSIGRFALVLALAPWLVCSIAVAPEHVHEADAHHAHTVAHRHFEAHDLDAHDQEKTEIEPSEGHVLWVNGDVALQYAVYHLIVDPLAVSPAFRIEPPVTTRLHVSVLDGSPPHGPPRRYTPVRAPPLHFRLI